MADSSPKRLDHIQGLRGLAALVVIIQHGLEIVQRSGLQPFGRFLEALNLGRFGVVLFFLISGLVIPYSFRGETPLRNFAISRLFQLYPAYWLSIPVLTGVAYLRGWTTNAQTILGNFTMIQELIGMRNIGWLLDIKVRANLLYHVPRVICSWLATQVCAKCIDRARTVVRGGHSCSLVWSRSDTQISFLPCNVLCRTAFASSFG